MKIGQYSVTSVTWGTFRLDGGAMFGSVPKNIWSRAIAVDEENCIPLAARSLLIEGAGRKILVDVGMGEKWSEKSRQIFAIRNKAFEELKFDPDSVTDVILTHLHFDHAGGISRFASDGATVEPVFKNATIHIQKANYENAQNPSLKERASYLKENWMTLKQVPLRLLESSGEVFDGIYVHRVDGHTVGQQWIEVRSGSDIIMFTTDVIPTSRHLPLPYTMGYDICAQTVLKEKDEFLKKAIAENAIVVFQHDPDTTAGRIYVNEKGHFALKETVEL